MKEMRPDLEKRIYRIMADEVIGGVQKALCIIRNYEFHGYDCSRIRTNLHTYLHNVITEYAKKNDKRRW